VGWGLNENRELSFPSCVKEQIRYGRVDFELLPKLDFKQRAYAVLRNSTSHSDAGFTSIRLSKLAYQAGDFLISIKARNGERWFNENFIL
jgi:hypothetical protein